MADEGLDALDAFMMSIKSGGMDSKTKMELKRRGVELRQQRTQLERLVALARPCNLPPLSTKSVVMAEWQYTSLPVVLRQNISRHANLPIFGGILPLPRGTCPQSHVGFMKSRF